MSYGSLSIINIYQTKAYELEDVKTILNESIGTDYKLGYTDEFEDTISVKVKEISEEQLSNLKTKLKEKYEIAEGTDNVIVLKAGHVSIKDTIKEYITPILITFVIVIVYYAVAFRKLGIMESFVNPIIKIVGIGALYIAVLAIVRIPINEYVVPVGMFIYLLSLLGITVCLDKKKDKIVLENQK